jgi:hypothetical protein
MAHEETVEEWLAKGGKIKHCEMGERGGTPAYRVSSEIISRVRARRSAARRSQIAKSARKEAKINAIINEFDLTRAWALEKLEAGVCEVTGIPFVLEADSRYSDETKDGKSTHPFAPSIDRIDCMRGYTKKNCQMVVWIYNRAKGEDSHEDVISLAKALVERD